MLVRYLRHDTSWTQVVIGSALQGSDREIPQCYREILSNPGQREADDDLGRDRDDQEDQVAGERVVAHVAGDLSRHPVALVPDHLAEVGVEPGVQAGQLQGAALPQHQAARRRVIERVDDEPAVHQEALGGADVEFLADRVKFDAVDLPDGRSIRKGASDAVVRQVKA